MGENAIHLKVLSHEKTVFESDIEELYVQAKDGRLGILKDHVPIICALDIGVCKAKSGEKSQCIATMGGILQFSDNRATILSDCAELDCNIDIARACAARDRAKSRLEARQNIDIKRAETALARAMARINAKENRI